MLVGDNGRCDPRPISNAVGLAWVSISDLARFEGVTSAAISKRVRRLVTQNQLETRAGKNKTKQVNLDQYEKLTGKHFERSRIPADEISRLAVRGEISTAQLAAARHYRMIWRARDTYVLRRVSSLLSVHDIDLCNRLLLHDQRLNAIARDMQFVRASLLHRLSKSLDTMIQEFFRQQAA